MAINDIQISQLANTTEVEEFDLLVLQRGGSNFNVSRDDLLASHADKVNNPHQVTKTQVELGNVDNYPSSSSTTLDNATTFATSKAVRDALVDAKTTASSDLSTHTGNLNNPHSTTKTQVGLGLIQNWPSTSTVGSSTEIYATQLGLQNAREEAKSASSVLLTAHTSNKTNPHEVTKDQVGLGQVNNYNISDSILTASSTLYASSKAVNSAYLNSTTNSNTYSDIHKNDKSNPHVVTKAQVSLGNVPNWTAGAVTLGNSPATFANEVAVRGYVADAINSYFNKTMPVGMVIALATEVSTPSSLGWAGTWVKLGTGVSLISKESSETINTVYGDNTVTLASGNLPAHTHPHTFALNDVGHSHNFSNNYVGSRTSVNKTGSVDCQDFNLRIISNDSTDMSQSNIYMTGAISNNITSNTPLNIKSKHLTVAYWQRTN